MADPADVMLVRLGGSSMRFRWLPYVKWCGSHPSLACRACLRSLPDSPTSGAGVLAVLDLRPLLRLGGPRGDRLVILDGGAEQPARQVPSARGTRALVGLIVDAALDMVQLPAGGLEPLPPGLSAEAAGVLTGITVVANTPIAVLTPSGLLGLQGRLAQPA